MKAPLKEKQKKKKEKVQFTWQSLGVNHPSLSLSARARGLSIFLVKEKMNNYIETKKKGETLLQARLRRLVKLKETGEQHKNLEPPMLEMLYVKYLQSEGLSRRTISDYLETLTNEGIFNGVL